MAAAGGVMAAAQRDWGRLLGYAALSSLGYFLLAWGTGSSHSLTLALLHMLNSRCCDHPHGGGIGHPAPAHSQ